MSVKLGNAKYGGEFKKRKFFKLKDGESVFRILPPLGELADDGRWSVFYKVHYGYRNSKGDMRVFQSTLERNHKTRMVEVPDAALERIEKLKAQMEKAKESNNKELQDKLKVLLEKYNLDSNHYMNVMDKDGNIGILKIRHRAKLALDSTIKSLRADGVDPISVKDGRFFIFRRSGLGLDTTFQVDTYKEKIKVEGIGTVERPIVHELTDEIIARLGTEAGELNKLFKRLSSEDVKRIVDSSDLVTGNSSVVDELFAAPAQVTEEVIEDDMDETEAPQTKATPTVETKTTPVVETKTVKTEEVSLTQTKTAPKAEVVVPKTQAQTITETSDDDFLKSLGL